MNAIKILFLSVVALTMLACSRDKSPTENFPTKLTEEGRQQLLGPVLVKVNDHLITERDLDLAIDRTLGNSALVQIDQQARQKVLESLVMSKSLALAKEAELSIDELIDVERNVQAYRDEMLAKKYLRDNVSPIPVTEAMVESYYAENPDQYGAKTQKRYEIIQAKGNLGSAERSEIISAFNTAKEQQDWAALARSLKAKKLAVEYSQGAATQGTFAVEFERIIKPLAEGESSSVFFMRKLPAVVRVTEVITSTPRPLAEVSNNIRKQLAPVQLKKAIKNAADTVMKDMNIEYQSDN